MDNLLSRVISAQVLGTKAFADGKPCIPCRDSELHKLLAGVVVGDGLPILQAWVRGWTLANLYGDIQ